MASKTIPAKLVVMCDRCGLETHQSLGPGRRRRKTVLTMEGEGLDNLGDPCCNAHKQWDLCDDCWLKIETAIETAMVLAGSERRACQDKSDGPDCPTCGGKRAPSGVDRGSWVHI